MCGYNQCVCVRVLRARVCVRTCVCACARAWATLCVFDNWGHSCECSKRCEPACGTGCAGAGAGAAFCNTFDATIKAWAAAGCQRPLPYLLPVEEQGAFNGRVQHRQNAGPRSTR